MRWKGEGLPGALYFSVSQCDFWQKYKVPGCDGMGAPGISNSKRLSVVLLLFNY
jgi:hypothetical protein